MDRRASTPGLAQLRAIYERMTDGILVVDEDGAIVDANPAARRMLGHASAPLEGETFGHPIADRAAVVIELLAPSGEVRTAEMRVSSIDWGGRSVHLLILRDVTEQAELLERLRRLANYDDLTGLPNRTLFFEHIEQAIREARRHGHRVGLLFVDFDDFKRVNDAFGHDAGDRLLRQIGERMAHALREEDSVARFSGDEFLVTVTHVADTREAEVVADKLLAVLAEPFDVDGRPVLMTASIGVAFYPDDGRDAALLLQRADKAMYGAKRLGGRRALRFQGP